VLKPMFLLTAKPAMYVPTSRSAASRATRCSRARGIREARRRAGRADQRRDRGADGRSSDEDKQVFSPTWA